MKARIIEGASDIFIKKAYKELKILPKSYIEYIDLLKELQGKTMNISRRYDNRIVLQYEKPKIINGKAVVGIDVGTDMVEII